MKPEYYYQRISSVMRDNQFDRYTDGHRTGKLGKKLYKVELNSDKVFSRREARLNKDYNVVLAVDLSGSMRGSKVEVAAYSTTMIAKALSNSHINFAIMGFNKFIHMYKSFDTELTKKQYEQMRDHMVSSVDVGGSCTHTYFAFLQAEEMIKGMKPSNTIVIFFTDGSPSCSCAVNSAAPSPHKLEDVCNRIDKKAMTITFGIKIDKERPIPKCIPNVVPIDTMDQFMGRSLYALQTLISRG